MIRKRLTTAERNDLIRACKADVAEQCEAQRRVQAEQAYHALMSEKIAQAQGLAQRAEAPFRPLYTPLAQVGATPYAGQSVVTYPGQVTMTTPSELSAVKQPMLPTSWHGDYEIVLAAQQLLEAYIISAEAVIPAVQLGRKGAPDPDNLLRELERIIRKHYPTAVDPQKELEKLVPMSKKPQPQPAKPPSAGFPDTAKTLPPLGEPWRPPNG